MTRSKKRKCDLVYKLDLEKAYDRVDWRFLRRTLQRYGFSASTIALIMHGITSTSISLLWNGTKTQCFSPKRGLHQGDPLSPYLFVLCMERLGEMITHEVQHQRWLPLKTSRNGPSLSHLFFADMFFYFLKQGLLRPA